MGSNLAENRDFIFRIVSSPSRVPDTARYIGYLVEDNWDDYASFETLYHFIVFDNEGKKYELGDVKIGEFGLAKANRVMGRKKGYRKPWLRREFHFLEEQFFSLGQDDNYYEVLGQFDDEFRNCLLYTSPSPRD